MNIENEIRSERDYLEFCKNRLEYLKRTNNELGNKVELTEDEYFIQLHLSHEFDVIISKINLCKQRISELNEELVKIN